MVSYWRHKEEGRKEGMWRVGAKDKTGGVAPPVVPLWRDSAATAARGVDNRGRDGAAATTQDAHDDGYA